MNWRSLIILGFMRVGVFSDVHGNVRALDAVLQAARDEGIDSFWCVGDLVAHGPRPVEVVARLREISGLTCVRGNTDRYVLTGDLGGIIPPIDRPRTPEEFRVLADARESFAWTRGCLVGGGHVEWLAGLPLEHRLMLPDGSRVLLVHASPGRDDGPGFRLENDDADLVAAGFASGTAELIFVGHTHVAGERRVAGCHVVNSGSVSLPPEPDDLARWVVLEATAAGYTVEHRSAQYDLAQVVDDLARQRHPARKWLAGKMARPGP
jgi:predicted phosphodiesterase